HGVPPIPDYSRQHNLGGNRIIGVELLASVEKAAEERFGPGKYISALANHQFYLNLKTIKDKGLNQSEIEDFVGKEAIKTDGIATYFTRTRLLAGEVANTDIGRRILAGFHPKRSGDVWLLVEPFTLIAHGPEELLGTDHGTPYQY